MDLPIGKGRLSTICNCLFPYFALPIAYFTLPIAYFILPIAYFILPIAYFILPIAYFILLIAYLLRGCRSEAVYHRLAHTPPYLSIVTNPLMALAVGFLRKM